MKTAKVQIMTRLKKFSSASIRGTRRNSSHITCLARKDWQRCYHSYRAPLGATLAVKSNSSSAGSVERSLSKQALCVGTPRSTILGSGTSLKALNLTRKSTPKLERQTV